MAKEEESNKRKHANLEEDKVVDDDKQEEKLGDNNKDTTTTPGTATATQETEEDGEGGEKSKRKRKRKRKKKNNGEQSNDTTTTGGGGGDGKADKCNSLEHTVYVEGMPFDCTEDEVKGFFVEHGCEDVLQMRLPRWQDSGRLRGYGHIVFDSVESKSKAISELNGKNLKRRYLNIQEAKPQGSGSLGGGRQSTGPRAQPDKCRVVFVKNLPYDNMTEEDVLQVFRSCGKIVDGGVRLARNYQTKQLKGFGYIEFKNPEGAYSAVQRAAKDEGIKVGGRMCFVDYDESIMKGSFKTANGELWQKKHGSVHNNNNNTQNKYGRR